MTGPSPRDAKSVGGWLVVLTHSHLLMLGLPLMALLVWLPDRLDCRDIELLADALHIPPAGVATVRETVRLAGRYVELPQRWWIGLYVLLAAVSVLLAVRPGLVPAVVQWFPRLPIVSSFNAPPGVAVAVQMEWLIGATALSAVACGLNACTAPRGVRAQVGRDSSEPLTARLGLEKRDHRLYLLAI